ncbi:uncharacterized protein BDV17DRAFT_261219 [Aspergillus undulatus]|uniref:uncharacterized protein n=1 Tax=Aspergillus undulatus TaxID=1810928 RepID=UPI003CCCD000
MFFVISLRVDSMNLTETSLASTSAIILLFTIRGYDPVVYCRYAHFRCRVLNATLTLMICLRPWARSPASLCHMRKMRSDQCSSGTEPPIDRSLTLLRRPRLGKSLKLEVSAWDGREGDNLEPVPSRIPAHGRTKGHSRRERDTKSRWQDSGSDISCSRHQILQESSAAHGFIKPAFVLAILQLIVSLVVIHLEITIVCRAPTAWDWAPIPSIKYSWCDRCLCRRYETSLCTE